MAAHPSPPESSISTATTAPIYRQASLDVLKMITIMRTLAAQDEISRTRVEVLEATVGGNSGMVA